MATQGARTRFPARIAGRVSEATKQAVLDEAYARDILEADVVREALNAYPPLARRMKYNRKAKR